MNNKGKTLTCLVCGGLFQPARPHHKFCTAYCRWRAWQFRHPRIGTPERKRFRALAEALENPKGN